VPRPGTPDIHPTWCRACSADLTVDTSADPLSLTELNRALALQDVFNQILESADAAAPAMGQMIPPPTYFLDLHIITTYLQATWEGSNHPADECTEGYDAWRTRGGHTQEKSAPSRATARWPPAPYDTPPLDAAACARVLLMATDILHSSSPQEAGDRLAALRHNEPNLEPWLDSLGRKRHTVPSDGLKQAIARLPRRFGVPRANPHAQLGARHIPQLLPAAWWPEADDRPKRGPALDLRTAAALRLAQILDGADLTAAATTLGIPPERASRAVKTIRTLEATSWVAFNAAIERIHAELASVTGLVDYGRRRQAMWSWRLSDDQWSALLDDRILLGWMRPHTQYRFYADVRIWCRVTQGLHLYSPMFRTMRRGSAAPLYTMLNSPAAQAKNHVFLDALHPRVERLADSIAAAIDTGLMV
jgi:hypothetical protein